MGCRKYSLPLILVFSLLVFLSARYGPVYAAPENEEAAILQAARAYLDAEVKRDLKAVYGLLAPSSEYVALNNFESYASDAGSSTVRILEYRILRVHRIRDNHDAGAFPNVDKFAQVEVDLKLFFSDVGKSAEVNYDFTFIKENGRWYKG